MSSDFDPTDGIAACEARLEDVGVLTSCTEQDERNSVGIMLRDQLMGLDLNGDDANDLIRSDLTASDLATASAAGRISQEMINKGRDNARESLINGARLNNLQTGAIWKGYQRQLLLMQVLEEEMPGITAKMQARLSDAQLPRLPL